MMLMMMIIIMLMNMMLMMMMLMMMMRRPSSLRVRAKPRHLPYIYIYVICLHVYNIVYIYSQYMPILCDYEIEMGLSGKWGRGIYPNFCLFKWGICPVSDGFGPMGWSFMEFHR